MSRCHVTLFPISFTTTSAKSAIAVALVPLGTLHIHCFQFLTGAWKVPRHQLLTVSFLFLGLILSMIPSMDSSAYHIVGASPYLQDK